MIGLAKFSFLAITKLLKEQKQRAAVPRTAFLPAKYVLLNFWNGLALKNIFRSLLHCTSDGAVTSEYVVCLAGISCASLGELFGIFTCRNTAIWKPSV